MEKVSKVKGFKLQTRLSLSKFVLSKKSQQNNEYNNITEEELL
jgi:hypothetical protein